MWYQLDKFYTVKLIAKQKCFEHINASFLFEFPYKV